MEWGDEIVVDGDVALPALVVHPHRRHVLLAGGLGLPGEVLEVYQIAGIAFLEVAVQHPLGLIGSGRTTVRALWYSHQHAPLAETVKGASETHGRVHFPRVLRPLVEAGQQVGPDLEAQGYDEIVVGDGGAFQDDLLAPGIDPQDLRLKHPDVAFFQALELSRDVLRTPLPHHHEQERRHVDVVGAAVDEDDVVVRAQGTAELGGGDDPAAAAAQHHDLLASVVVVHP